MKTILTVEESQRLIDLGVDPQMASKKEDAQSYYDWCCGREPNSDDIKPIFDLSDLLSILPKEIEDSNLNIISTQVKNHKKVSGWIATYIDSYNDLAFGYESIFQAPELIDALNSLLIWCLTEKKINLNQKEQ